MFIESFKVESPNVKYTANEIHSVYNYETTELVHELKNGSYQWTVKPKTVKYEFNTQTHVPKLGFVFMILVNFVVLIIFFTRRKFVMHLCCIVQGYARWMGWK